MPRIENSVVIAEDPRKVFDITNDIDRWSEIFDEYSAAEVVTRERDGRWTEIVFELTDHEGRSWRSWRLLDHRELVVYAERRDPLFPFRYMHLRWSYRAVAGGTEMTWVQDFEPADGFDVPLESMVERMQVHTRRNQAGIRRIIESGAVRAA
ncbi:polyketide cyclase [Streptomyces ruber]|uniref:Polyketide cyclase n=2 Tax=Streptomyces TaxID=1883 RepID=A0A918B9W6_9ACTN|nr:SRPBCC family protein [Streptomyces ruber]GGQ47870.1 polyketide cyclase [Streptomyces ruber]